MTGRLAIDGGTPVRTAPWPAWPRSGAAERRALTEVLESGRWGLGGGAVPELEARFAALHGARYAVACCNGTMALQAALVAAGVQPGDEVITSPYSFAATAHAIRSLGAVPAFADVAAGTHNLDPARIEDAITERTTAILPVHIGGRPADMDRVNEIAARRGLRVIEDAAQAWLAGWRGRAVGTLGDAGAFSFQSSKNLTAGEGGMVLTDDESVYRSAVVVARLRPRARRFAARARGDVGTQPPHDRVPGGAAPRRTGTPPRRAGHPPAGHGRAREGSRRHRRPANAGPGRAHHRARLPHLHGPARRIPDGGRPTRQKPRQTPRDRGAPR